jgi:hypothetical protein
MLRRYLLILTIAWWMGGLTFYSVIVIPTATHVLGSHRDVGFITQQVTHWLNLSGLVPIGILFWNLKSEWPGTAMGLRKLLATSLAVVVVCQLGLFLAHAWVSHALDSQHHHILDDDSFRMRHGTYETIVTIQWIAVLLQTWLALRIWKERDLRGAIAHSTDIATNKSSAATCLRS